MNIIKIYKKYNIPPNLQLHMLRVASMANIIADNWCEKDLINKETLIKSCLLHDLGNIIKFDFDNFPELMGDEVKNINYWKNVKEKIIQKYGQDEDVATIKMVEELGIADKILFIVKNWGFKNFTRIENSDNWNWKIAVYCDHRISPSGAVSLIDNIKNKQTRYAHSRPHSSHLSAQANLLLNSAIKIEENIKRNISIDITNISTNEIEKHIKQLQRLDI